MLQPVPEVSTEPRASSHGSFWELIGLRVLGMKKLLVGAVEFQRQCKGSAARQSLSQYLSSPPRNLNLKTADYPTHLLKVAIRPPERGLKEFVQGLNRGDRARIAMFDTDMVHLCFDFRRENPSIERKRFQADPGARMCFRTIEGHVLTGFLHTPVQRLRRTDSFLGVTRVLQHTSLGDLPMPDLIVHRRFFSAVAEFSDEQLSPPVFDPSSQSARPLVGLPAWRYFMSSRPGELDSATGAPIAAAAGTKVGS